MDPDKLREIKNAVAVILRLDSIKGEDVLTVTKELIGIIDKLPEREKDLLREYIGTYFKLLEKRTGISIPSEEIEIINSEKEVNHMFRRFEEALEEYIKYEREKAIKEGMRRGIEEGIEKGIEKGREEGIKESMQFVINLKYGKKYAKDLHLL